MKIHLDKVENAIGFTVSNTEEGRSAEVLTKAAITSDEPQFYPYIEQIAGSYLNKNNIHVDSIYQFLVIIHQDLSVDLYINDFQVVIEIMCKKDIEKGDLVRESDIADIRSLKFPEIEIIETDKIIYCFKVGWKFGLFFNLDPNQQLKHDLLHSELGNVYRYLRFEYVYNLLESELRFEEILKDGWFPFIALLGSEYRSLIGIYQNKFDFENKITNFMNMFDTSRIARIIRKWWNKQIFKDKQPILEAGVNAYLMGINDGYINCIKNLFTEIDGIIRLQYFKDTGKGNINTKGLLNYVLEKGQTKSGSDVSLFLPTHFLKYLNDFVFTDFDLEKGKINLSRHSTCHGVASVESYTKMRALQEILILDQIFFYI